MALTNYISGNISESLHMESFPDKAIKLIGRSEEGIAMRLAPSMSRGNKGMQWPLTGCSQESEDVCVAVAQHCARPQRSQLPGRPRAHHRCVDQTAAQQPAHAC